MSEETKTGTIKRIFFKKGYGFITNSEANEDIFFHATGCVDPKFDDLRDGKKVNYLESTRNERAIAIGVVAI